MVVETPGQLPSLPSPKSGPGCWMYERSEHSLTRIDPELTADWVDTTTGLRFGRAVLTMIF